MQKRVCLQCRLGLKLRKKLGNKADPSNNQAESHRCQLIKFICLQDFRETKSNIRNKVHMPH